MTPTRCNICGEDMVELELYDFGDGHRGVEYECPNHCEFVKYRERNGDQR